MAISDLFKIVTPMNKLSPVLQSKLCTPRLSNYDNLITRKLTCPRCKHVLKGNNEIQRHLSTVCTTVPVYKCPECVVLHTYKAHYVRHLRQHKRRHRFNAKQKKMAPQPEPPVVSS